MVLAGYLKNLVKDEDDDFFHVSCHIEGSLKDKIEQGEYVELEKLLPCTCAQVTNPEHRLQLVQKDGETFLGMADTRQLQINSVRKWEQAFRVYATIYSQANPSRSSEIWQYVHVINTAAQSFSWENVAYYDTTFRHLMAKRPERSWAKTYTQLWNIAMCDPLGKFGHSSYGTLQSRSDSKDNICWRWNKGKCKKWNCKFEHKCSYCGMHNHQYSNCMKRKTVPVKPQQRFTHPPVK